MYVNAHQSTTISSYNPQTYCYFRRWYAFARICPQRKLIKPHRLLARLYIWVSLFGANHFVPRSEAEEIVSLQDIFADDARQNRANNHMVGKGAYAYRDSEGASKILAYLAKPDVMISPADHFLLSQGLIINKDQHRPSTLVHHCTCWLCTSSLSHHTGAEPSRCASSAISTFYTNFLLP